MTSIVAPRTRIAVGAPTWAGLAIVGAVVLGALGLFLDPAVGWLTRQDWLPLGALVEVGQRVAAACPVWAQVLVGVVLGTIAGLAVAGQTTTVEVSGAEVVVLEGSKRQRVARSQAGLAVLEGRRLSVRDRQDVDLLTVLVDGDVAALREALAAHGWPVRDGA